MAVFLRVFLFATLLSIASTAFGVAEEEILPVDEAFEVSVVAPSADRIEVHWRIASGYYLYRHRVDAAVLGDGFAAGTMQLPTGQPVRDEFFGDVEIYRDRLVATLDRMPAASAMASPATIDLRVKYQGCADSGICYPPQTRVLRVDLPVSTALDATLLGGGMMSSVSPIGEGSPVIAGVSTPALPEDQAFQFDAWLADDRTLSLQFSAASGYYLYRDQMRLALTPEETARLGVPAWPEGSMLHDAHFGDVIVYYGQAQVRVPLLRERPGSERVTLSARFQGCQNNGICYPPMTRRLELLLPEVNQQAPVADPDTVSSADALAVGGEPDAQFDASEAPVTEASLANTGVAVATMPNARVPPPLSLALWKVLLAALLGGIVLNLMPCVFPVLSLKALGVLKSGESRKHARGHAFWYTLGVLVSFAAIGGLVLILQAAGRQAAWGFQLQYPWFVAALIYLVFAMGLSLSGLLTLGAGAGGIGQQLTSRSGPIGDFFTGVLACVLASPCIGPFMGVALAYAFIAPPLQALLVFVMLGIGLALPFLMIGFMPGIARWLPKPGRWMETLKQVFAFPMYMTAVWLLWVLGSQKGVDAMAQVLVGGVVLAFGLWWHERSRWRGAMLGRIFSVAVIVLALIPIWSVSHTDAARKETVVYSADVLQRLRDEGQVVFVNMTAEWCVTCKANEYSVLSRQAFQNALSNADAVYMKGDWTNGDPQVGAFLQQHGAVGVPLYVVYGPGTPPQLLPPLLTETIVEDALRHAHGQK